MKKIMIVAGLLALSSVAATAASVKTSKAVPLNDTQMASVKGQGYLYVYYWNGFSYVTVYAGLDLGNTSYYAQIVHSGGPQNGVVYVY